MAEWNASLLGATGAARRLRANFAGRAIGHRVARLRRQLTGEIGPHAELIATGWAGAGKRLLRTPGQAGGATALVGQACLTALAFAMIGLAAVVFSLAAVVAGADLDPFYLAVLTVRPPRRCHVGQPQERSGSKGQAEGAAGADGPGEAIEALHVHTITLLFHWRSCRCPPTELDGRAERIASRRRPFRHTASPCRPRQTGSRRSRNMTKRPRRGRRSSGRPVRRPRRRSSRQGSPARSSGRNCHFFFFFAVAASARPNSAAPNARPTRRRVPSRRARRSNWLLLLSTAISVPEARRSSMIAD
jgi:hypothetical protein